jgi:hypothetical protein
VTEQRASLDAAVSFANVIDAFHISRGGQPTQTRFFTPASPPGGAEVPWPGGTAQRRVLFWVSASGHALPVPTRCRNLDV